MLATSHGPRTTDHGRNAFTLIQRRTEFIPFRARERNQFRSTTRAAFTLIELLVVMSIMATLMALTAGAVSRVIGANRVSTSTEIVRRLNVLTEQAVRQVIDSANEERIPQWALTAASNEVDMARRLYVNARLTQEFPMTYAEALNPTPLLRDETYYQKLNGATGAGGDSEKSACLHMALTAKTRRGDRSDSQFVAEYTKEDSRGIKIIYDAWDEPIYFLRRTSSEKPVIIVVSNGPNRKKGTFNFDANGNLTASDNDANDNIYSVFVGR